MEIYSLWVLKCSCAPPPSPQHPNIRLGLNREQEICTCHHCSSVGNLFPGDKFPFCLTDEPFPPSMRFLRKSQLPAGYRVCLSTMV